MAVLQQLSKLSGPRKVLLGGAALYLCVATFPWYRIEGRGFVIEFSGWHELGVLVGILAIDVVAWELLRLSGYAPVDGARGDRFSALGGLVLGLVGAVFVLVRLSEGSLAYGWVLGAVVIGAIALSAVSLFVDAGGPGALAALVGRGPVVDTPGAPPPTVAERPRPGTPTAAELREPVLPAHPGWRDSPYATGRSAGATGPVGPAGPPAERPSGGRSAADRPTVDRPPAGGPRPWSVMADPPAGKRGRGSGADGVVAPAPGRPEADRERPAPAVPSAPRARPVPPWRRPDPAPPAARPAWRAHPEDAEPPPRGWPKTAAEKQRDQPPLWSGRDEGDGRGPGRPDGGR